MKKFMTAILPMALTICLCACAGGTTAPSNTVPPASAETPEKAAATAEVKTAEAGELRSTLPEDNGLAGVYKWVEMADIGVDAYLILWDDGVGLLDMLGVVENVSYDDHMMQSSGEGALPQNYAYADGTLTWTSTAKDGVSVSTFVKLTPEELAAYQARGIGNAE